MIDISKADKAEVLKRLFNAATMTSPHPAAKRQAAATPQLTYEEAKAVVAGQLDFDWIAGRSVKVDLRGDSFDEWLYNRDNGEGAAQKALEDCPGVDCHVKLKSPLG